MAATIRGLFNDVSLTNLTVPGTESEVRLTAGHALHVNLRSQDGTEIGTVANPLVTTSSGGGGGGVSVIDGSPFTAGVSSFAPTGGVFNDSVAALASGTAGEVRLTAARSMHVMLRDAAGAALLGQHIMLQSLPVAIASDQNNLDINLHDGVGNPIGSVGGAINVNIASGGGSGFSVPDGTAWAAGVTALVPTGGVFNDSAAALAAGNEGTVRMSANRAFHVNNRTAAGVELLGQQAMAGSLPVVIASNQSAVTITGAVTVTGTVTTTPPANASTNITQLNGVAVSVGSGASNTGTQRVILATDNPTLTVTGTITTTPPANASSNISQIGGTAVAVNNGTANTGTQRVAIASDNTPFTVVVTQATAANLNAEVVGDVASGSADAGNPVKIGGRAATTQPTAVTDGQRVNAMMDKQGRQITAISPRATSVRGPATTISNTTETSILPTGGAGIFRDITLIMVTNSSATAVRVDFRDVSGGTVQFSLALAANGGAIVQPINPINQTTANSAWTAQLSASVTDVRISAHAIERN